MREYRILMILRYKDRFDGEREIKNNNSYIVYRIEDEPRRKSLQTSGNNDELFCIFFSWRNNLWRLKKHWSSLEFEWGRGKHHGDFALRDFLFGFVTTDSNYANLQGVNSIKGGYSLKADKTLTYNIGTAFNMIIVANVT